MCLLQQVRLRITAMENTAARLVSFNGESRDTSREVDFDSEDAVKKVLTAKRCRGDIEEALG